MRRPWVRFPPPAPKILIKTGDTMKKILPCMQCLVEKGKPQFFELVNVSNDGIMSFTCQNGHIQKILTQNFKFEILIEYAISLYAS